MSENRVSKLNQLYLDFRAGKIDRRSFIMHASALGLSATMMAKFMPAALAQDATPSAEGVDNSYTSITSDEAIAQTEQDFGFGEAENEGGVVIMGAVSTATLTTTNPLLSQNIPTSPVLGLLFDGLVGVEMTTFQFVPSLADHYEISADGLTYTYYLRQDVVWSDGTPFTADDVLMTWDAQADPDTGTQYTADYNNVVASHSKIDDYTVQQTATELFAPIVFLGSASPSIVPAHIWADVPHADWVTDPGSTGTDASRVVGTGPFRFQELNQTDLTATFVKNELHWGKVPNIDTYIFQPWPDDVAAVEALRAGDVDFLSPIPPADVDSLIAEDNVDIIFFDTFSFGFYGYNLNEEKTTLFQDVRTRQGLFYALDRESIVENIHLGRAEVAVGTHSTLSIGYAPDRINTIYEYDPEKAAALLAEAGWEDTDGDGILELDGQKLEFSIMYGAGGTNDQIAAYMADVWSQLGANVTPDPVDFGTVLVPTVTTTFDFQVAMLGLSWGPDGDQSAMWHSRNIDGAGLNLARYVNPEYDRLADLANVTVDPDQRREYLIEASNIANDDLAYGIINFTKGRTGYQTRLQNYVSTALSSGHMWCLPYVWIQE